MCVVCQRDLVGLTVVNDGVNTRHFAPANTLDRQRIGVSSITSRHSSVGHLLHAFHPFILAVEFSNDIFGQRNGRSRRCIEFMHVVRLFYSHVILRKLVHNLCQLTIQCTENSHTNREVRCPEQRLPTLGTQLSDLSTVVFHPARRSAYHFHIVLESPQIIAECRLGCGKFNGHISRNKCLAVKVLLIIYVDDTHDFVPAAARCLLDHPPHLAISD